MDDYVFVGDQVPSPPRPPVHTQREREGSPLFHVTEQVPPGPGQEFFRTPFILRLKYIFIFDKEKKFILSKIHLVSSYSRELIDSRVDEKAFEAGYPKSHHGLGDVRCIFPLTSDIHRGFLLYPASLCTILRRHWENHTRAILKR